MSIRINEVLDYLDIHPINQHEDAFSAMEVIFHAYSMYNSMDSDILQELRNKMFSILGKLPDSDAEKLLDVVGDLIIEKEKTAFSHGIAMGIYMETELSMLP